MVALIGLIFFSTNDDFVTNNEENKIIFNSQTKNEDENGIINNGGSVLKYNDYVYYINTKNSSGDGFSNKLCRRNIVEEGKEEVLYNANQYKIEDRLMIFDNKIFFSMLGHTYYLDFDNSNSMVRYNQGILYYIGDGNLVYMYENNIFKATYYLKTLGIKGISKIATNSSNFICENEEDLYFYGENKESIIKINKASQNVEFLDINFWDDNIVIYDLKLNGKNVELYKSGDFVTTILRGIDNSVSLESIEEIDDYLYIRFNLMENEIIVESMFYKVRKDGSYVERINDTF